MHHPSTQAVYAYWNEVRKGRIAPARLEIEPQRIGSALIDAFILERIDRKTYAFRLAGTRVTVRFGMDLRQSNFLDLWSRRERDMIEHYLNASTEEGQVSLFTAEATLQRAPSTPMAFEFLMLPLVHTGGAMDRLLCIMAPVEGEERMDGRIEGMSLLAAERVTGDEFSSEADRFRDGLTDRQAPLSPHIRNSRLVRSGRRQFRVYDGGLAQHAQD